MLNPSLILGVDATVGFAGDHKEDSKKAKNGPKCYEHGGSAFSWLYRLMVFGEKRLTNLS